MRCYSRCGKRALDVSMAALFLVVTSPILVVLSAALLVTEGRPVLFRQERAGRHMQSFSLMKFRTMRPPTGHQERGSEADRISPIGGFLRRTSLDELPELVNVIRGEMSLVGPRPLPLHYSPYFYPEEMLRFEVRPGITGLAQVTGRNGIAWSQRFALDVEYVRALSIRADVEILWRTIQVALSGTGLAVDPGGVMQDLDIERVDMLKETDADGA